MEIMVALKRAEVLTQQLNWVWEVAKDILSQGPDASPQALLLPSNDLGQREGLEDPLCL